MTLYIKFTRSFVVCLALGASLMFAEDAWRSSTRQANANSSQLTFWGIFFYTNIAITLIWSAWASKTIAIPLWIARKKQLGRSCPFCGYHLANHDSTPTICPECGSRGQVSEIQKYWKEIFTFPFWRWSDSALLEKHGISKPPET